MESQDLWFAGNWKIKIWKGSINSTRRFFFLLIIIIQTMSGKHTEERLFTDAVLDLRWLNQKCDHSLWFLPHHRAAPSFQMTAEKRPSSDMMKPKPKPQKKKKKKDPNEPTKPVSAYALFFRDTQAAIKGQNPNATFGDVSKIVASMWDGLGEEQKQVWKDIELLVKSVLSQLLLKVSVSFDAEKNPKTKHLINTSASSPPCGQMCLNRSHERSARV